MEAGHCHHPSGGVCVSPSHSCDPLSPTSLLRTLSHLPSSVPFPTFSSSQPQGHKHYCSLSGSFQIRRWYFSKENMSIINGTGLISIFMCSCLPTGNVGSLYSPFSPWLHPGPGVLDVGGFSCQSMLSFSHSRSGEVGLSYLLLVQFVFQLLLSFVWCLQSEGIWVPRTFFHLNFL